MAERDRSEDRESRGRPDSHRSGTITERNPLTMRLVHIACVIALGALALTAFVSSTSPIRFEDIVGSSGVHFITENCPTPEKHQPETMPAGIPLFDYDGDGLLDIYL